MSRNDRTKWMDEILGRLRDADMSNDGELQILLVLAVLEVEAAITSVDDGLCRLTGQVEAAGYHAGGKSMF